MAERPWGYWTEQKLSMLADYLPCFTAASKKARTTLYLDLFAGDVENVSRTTGAAIAGLTWTSPPSHASLCMR